MKAQSTLTAPWEICEDDFPSRGSYLDKWEFLLNYAILAPSTHNSQPWLFHINYDQVELFADRSRSCPVVDPDGRELTMSCGCALFNLRLALAHFALLGETRILPSPADPDLLAVLSLGTSTEEEAEQKLFQAIVARRTNRQQFEDTPVSGELVAALQWAAGRESAWLFVLDHSVKLQTAELIAQADRQQWASPEFRLELSRWVHPGGRPVRDGIPTYAHGLDDLLSYDGPLTVRTFDLGDGQAAMDHQLASGSPLLVVLGTSHDSPLDWLNAGQALQRVLLRARADSLYGSFLNQPLEVPDLRLKATELFAQNGFPQAILRLGFGPQIKPTPRRELNEVLI